MSPRNFAPHQLPRTLDLPTSPAPSPALYLVWQRYAYSQHKVQNLPSKKTANGVRSSYSQMKLTIQ